MWTGGRRYIQKWNCPNCCNTVTTIITTMMILVMVIIIIIIIAVSHQVQVHVRIAAKIMKLLQGHDKLIQRLEQLQLLYSKIVDVGSYSRYSNRCWSFSNRSRKWTDTEMVVMVIIIIITIFIIMVVSYDEVRSHVKIFAKIMKLMLSPCRTSISIYKGLSSCSTCTARALTLVVLACIVASTADRGIGLIPRQQ